MTTAKELHENLRNAGIERDLRTIQRQLEMLCEHFDIECDNRSRPYGYRWLEQARGWSMPSLSPQESLLLRLSEEYLKNLLPARLMKSLQGFFEQSRRNLSPDHHSSLEKEWLKKIRVVKTIQPQIPPKIDQEIFDTISEALFSNRWLHLVYQNAQGKTSESQVMPLGLAQQDMRLYLVCRFKGYDNERSLAIHRITAAAASTLTFDRPKDFSLEKYDNDGRFALGDGKLVTLTFKTTKKQAIYFIEAPLSKDQTFTIEGDHYEFTATVVDSILLKRWLNSYGDSIWNTNMEPTEK